MKDLFSLKDKVVVVTGGFGLLGQQFALAIAGQGGRVALIDVVDKPRMAIPSFMDLFERQDRIKAFKADITNRAELEQTLLKIKETWEVPFGLVNNAALDSPPNAPASENGPFETYPLESLSKVIDVNLKGLVVTCQVFGAAMAEQGRGSIINISSIYGMLSPNQDIYEYKRKAGVDWYKPVGYSVTKSGVLNLTRYLATYWAKKGVRVNTLTPSGIFNNQDETFLEEYTKRIPIGRMAKPDEMNGAVVFMLSEGSTYMTGSNLVVDGGWTAW